MNLIFMFLFILLSSSLSFAVPDCAAPLGGTVKKVILSWSGVDCKSAQTQAEEINKIGALFGHPGGITLYFGGEDNNAGFDEGHILVVPEFFVNYGKYGGVARGYQMQIYGIVAHEFGHSIFQEALKKVLPAEYRSIVERMQRDSDQREQAYLQGHQMNKPTYHDIPLYGPYLNAVLPYSELIADTVAVYFYDDPSVVFNALYIDDHDPRQQKFQRIAPNFLLRDFKLNHGLEDIEKNLEVHTQLSLVRSWIGKNLMPRNQKQKITYFEALKRASIQAILEILKTGRIPNVKDQNHQLIQNIQAELKK